MRVGSLFALLLLVGCNPGSTGGNGNGDGGGGGGDAGDGDGGGGCAGCQTPRVCRFNACIDAPRPCTEDAQCSDDSYCEAGECIPYGVGPRGDHDPMCKRLQVLGLFAPKTQCEWPGPATPAEFGAHKNVLSTPLVADFDFDNDAKTLTPSIVFVTYNCDDGSCGAEPGCYGIIRVIDGKSCTLQHSLGTAGLLIGSVTPAIGDINGDGRPDIVAEHIGGGIAGYSYDAVQGKFVELWTNYSSFNAAGCHWGSLAIHDLDDDGVPEILQMDGNPAVFSNTGVLLASAATNITYVAFLHPTAADVDGDGSVELLDGREAFRYTKGNATLAVDTAMGNATYGLGFTALADFGTYGAAPGNDDRAKLDGIPELAVVTRGMARIQTLSGRVIFGPVALPTDGVGVVGTGGAPTVADFDGDGRAEFGVAGATAYAVFDIDCVTGAMQKYCPSQTTTGVLWSKKAQDASSNVSGSSVFDFDGDGKAEVVYADECFSRVYDGRSGDVLFSQYHTSCTWYENPIVADVDGDFRSEIVIPSNRNCSVSCPALDPVHDGVRCDVAADCPGTTSCVRENAGDPYGRCRCAAKTDCGAANLDCVDPVAGPSAKGKVCRALHPVGVDQQGILVMHDVLDRWVGSRPIWNQHAYSVTNVNDNGTIPKTSAWTANWKSPKLNNYRQNSPGALDPENVPDLTSAGDGALGQMVQLVCDAGTLKLKARVCNRGTGPVASGIPVTFYEGPKANGRAICTTATATTLNAGQCEVIGCDWVMAPTSPTDVSVVADDDGTGKGASAECEEANNLGTLLGIFCNTIG